LASCLPCSLSLNASAAGRELNRTANLFPATAPEPIDSPLPRPALRTAGRGVAKRPLPPAPRQAVPLATTGACPRRAMTEGLDSRPSFEISLRHRGVYLRGALTDWLERPITALKPASQRSTGVKPAGAVALPAVAAFQGGAQSLFPLTQGCGRCAALPLGYPVTAFQAGDNDDRRLAVSHRWR
jgi:hypothetical protein